MVTKASGNNTNDIQAAKSFGHGKDAVGKPLKVFAGLLSNISFHEG
jgi:hypothetical protein